MRDARLDGLFGMAEMEDVVGFMLAKAAGRGCDVRQVDLHPSSFDGEGNQDGLLTGFVEMVYCGWLDKSGPVSSGNHLYNGGFRACPKLIARLEERGLI